MPTAALKENPCELHFDCTELSRTGNLSKLRRRLSPVSYTHLDVYKRQTQIWIAVSIYVLVAIVRKRLGLVASLYPVSYTHLDVYKRQAKCRRESIG